MYTSIIYYTPPFLKQANIDHTEDLSPLKKNLAIIF